MAVGLDYSHQLTAWDVVRIKKNNVRLDSGAYSIISSQFNSYNEGMVINNGVERSKINRWDKTPFQNWKGAMSKWEITLNSQERFVRLEAAGKGRSSIWRIKDIYDNGSGRYK